MRFGGGGGSGIVHCGGGSALFKHLLMCSSMSNELGQRGELVCLNER